MVNHPQYAGLDITVIHTAALNDPLGQWQGPDCQRHNLTFQ